MKKHLRGFLKRKTKSQDKKVDSAGWIDYATVSAAIKQLEQRALQDPNLTELINKADERLLNPKI